MREHKGMRPQDIVVLLKIIVKGDGWQNKDLAAELFLSPSEISESLHRSAVGNLINAAKRNVHRQTLLEFLQYGLHVVFPVVPGGMVNGLPTAHSHPFMQQYFKSEVKYVWPDVLAGDRGLSITPLYKDVVKAVQKDTKLYQMLALLDIIRVGRLRELDIAIKELTKLIKNEPSR